MSFSLRDDQLRLIETLQGSIDVVTIEKNICFFLAHKSGKELKQLAPGEQHVDRYCRHRDDVKACVEANR